ncbi:MAG TPA: N-acetylmuramoyl-L-alanine amidase [Candidatus Bathyarchaeia archaeon]|nr:N-acetylmuramoyl-L-alanine amidase [Candidatus Bathyarchaeia archaeon]
MYFYRRLSFLCLFFFPAQAMQPHIIVLDPAGDSHNPGRVIEDTFERTIAWRCATYVQEQLTARNDTIAVFITRQSGDFSAPLQRAQYVNRIAAHAVVSLSFYQATETADIFLYMYGNGDDFFPIINPLGWYTADQAHLLCAKEHGALAALFYTHFMQHCHTYASVHAPYKIPCTALFGMAVPACLIEIGLKKADDWQWYGDHLVAVLEKACNVW